MMLIYLAARIAMLGLAAVLSIASAADYVHTGIYPEAETFYGTLKGNRLQNDVNGRVVDEFLGVPYAAPPVGELRWKLPQAPATWTGVRNATDYSNHCVQLSTPDVSEDCLYLNVIVPNGIDNIAELLPVMVFFHGGGFIAGSSASYLLHDVALHGNVIQVAFNYRLSTLGWATTGDSILAGNYGLWDCRAALLWVQQNVHHFGGNADLVTIYGQSAGAGLTSHATISPQMNGLFHHAIHLSGTSSGFFGVADRNNSAASTFELARWLGCNDTDTSENVYDCLMQQDAQSLDFWGVVGVVTRRQQLPNWLPVVDGLYLPESESFVPRHPVESWRQGAADAYDMITGHCHHDGSAFINGDLYSIGNGSGYGWAATPATTRIGLVFINQVYDQPANATDAIYEQYPLINSGDDETRVLALIQALTDWWFEASASFEAEEHSKTSAQSSTYLYDFHYDQSFFDRPDWAEATHSDDLFSLFGDQHFGGRNFSEADYRMSSTLMSYYTNFAHTGNPNIGPHSVPSVWPQFDAIERQKLEIVEQPRVVVEDNAMVERYRFWQEQWPLIATPRDPWNNDNLTPSEDISEFPSHKEAVDIFFSYLWKTYEGFLEENPTIWDNIQRIAQQELERIEMKKMKFSNQ